MPTQSSTSGSRKGHAGGTTGSGVGKAGGSHQAARFADSPIPPIDSQTFRDLLIFEERLKQNASRLQKRKKKYESLLVLSFTGILYLSYYVFIDQPELMILHRLNLALLLFLSTSVFLFFASGMYADRIVAANKFVPQANRSLRNFNMYLNTRTAPRRGILARIFLPFGGKRARGRAGSGVSSGGEEGLALNTFDGPIARSFTPPPGSKGRPMSRANSLGKRVATNPLPLAANPRGELVFHSRVAGAFREGYERYRAAFERRRSEKLEAKRRSGWRWWLYTGAGWGWWVKEIWKPPEPEPLVQTAQSAPHSHPRHAHGGGTGAPRVRSGTVTSIGSNASGEMTEIHSDGSRPSTPKKSSSTRASRAHKRMSSANALQQIQNQASTSESGYAESAEFHRQEPSDAGMGAGYLSAPIGTRSKRSSRESCPEGPRLERGRDSRPTPMIRTESYAETEILPVASAVASTADDRRDPISTLREPEVSQASSDATLERGEGL